MRHVIEWTIRTAGHTHDQMRPSRTNLSIK